MAILAKPSRSYAKVDHDDSGLSSAVNGPYASRKTEGGFKTYRPPLTETHLRRPLGYDPHPNSHFAPLPPAFQLTGKHKSKKDQALAGQRAELDHILQPEYKSGLDRDDSSSIAGPSRQPSNRTAGGVNGFSDRKGKHSAGSIRPSPSISSFKQTLAGGGGSRRAGGLGGIYIDSDGKVHDNEFEPFGNIAEMSRRKSRRRSAFGSDRHRDSDASSGSESGSGDVDNGPVRRSVEIGVHEDRNKDREEEEIRRRLEQERKRLDDVSGYAAARRRSMMSERSGRGTPSIRSSEDGPVSTYSVSLAPNGRTKSQAGYYIPSPLSPTFGAPPTGSSYNTARTMPTTAEEDGSDTTPEKTTENTKTNRPHTKSKVEVAPDGSRKVTGFDAPVTPVPPMTPAMPNHLRAPSVPDTGRLSMASRGSSDYTRERPPKPAERPREDLFPETPAQIKRREDRERRSGRTSAMGMGPRVSSLAVDTVIAGNGRGRILPEIEIVEDDDPRIIFPSDGKSTRVQIQHDHIIKGPFGHALSAQGGGGDSSRRASSAKSIVGSRVSSTMDDDGGYLPSRWANGDKNLRVTEDERDKYRPMEWSKHGDSTAKDEWKPTAKDQVKRNMKDIATNARFSLFRTKKKLLRKADM